MRISITRCLAAAAVTTVAAFAAAAPSQAYELRDFGVGLTNPGTVESPTPDRPQLTAGAYPDVTFDLQYPAEVNDWGGQDVVESVKDVDVDLPRGLIFNPTAMPTCTNRLLSTDYSAWCPLSSQIGVAWVGLSGFEQSFPIYNLVPPPGMPAQFGFNVVKTTIKLNGYVRSDGDYGLSASVRGISQALPLTGTRIVLWGVPAAAVHDAERITSRPDYSLVTGPANVAEKPLVTNPGRCTGEPLRFTADAASWLRPDASSPKSTTTQRVTGEPLTITGCESLPFSPSVRVQPTTSTPDSPTGLDVTVSVPQSENPQVPASAHLKDLTIVLPEGMNVNPSAADGLTSCSPAQVALSSKAPAACPDASALGSVTIDTPLLEQPLRGKAYLAAQNDNPFNTTLAMYLTAEGDGVVIKLAGRIDADPGTGRLRVTFADNPELPFNTMRVTLDGGDRAPLTTPPTCGYQMVHAAATPWSGKPAVGLTDGFNVDCVPGLGGFVPGFTANTKSPTAGLFSPFAVSLTRADGHAPIKDVSVALPPGLLAKIDGVPLCNDAQAGNGSCNPVSRVGSVTVTAGTGSKPFPLPGEVFLTGPYKGAPYGLSVRVPVFAGPLNLGMVVVRQALHIDPETTQVTAISDPLPTILSGIPVRLRKLDLVLDRKDFTVNPTNCDRKDVSGSIGALGGATAPVSSRFQVGGCEALPLSPKLSLQLVGKGRTLRKGGHPGIKARMTMPKSQTGLRRVDVTMPLTLALDPQNAKALCETAVGATKDPKCPKESIVGTASVKSPLLPATLTGPVYFVKGERTTSTGRKVATLPTLVLPLRGNGVQINVRATTTVKNKKLVAQFEGLPDAPVSQFDLRLNGGKNGILEVTRSACSTDRRATLRFTGHSKRVRSGSTQLSMGCK
ncbi:MAG: hypothetical protein WC558_11205 [Patulibacter sp.]